MTDKPTAEQAVLIQPQPAPTELLAARTAAGLSQAEAAALCGLAAAMRWSEYERGVRTIDSARWTLFLLATGQHPTSSLIAR